MANGQMTWHEAVVEVLRQNQAAMHYADIADAIVENGLIETVGATPKNTVNAQLSTDLQQNGEDSTFVRVRRGEYMLREHYDGTPTPPESSESSEDASGEESGIVQAFGMYWQRENVLWSTSPSLLGLQNQDADVVDFCDQRGVYLLHDRRSVVYIGRSTKRPLGRRLYEHTTDRLNGRWDRFSWFGIRGVTDNGDLTEDVEMNYDEGALIATLEALLLEALEPPQNRRRGEGFRAVEYLQAQDPTLKNTEILSVLDRMRSQLTT
jgi:hypothetical protein